MQGIELRIKGKVQGVGFRPFVWLLANQYGLNGDVNNDGQGVLIRFVSPPSGSLEQFLSDLQNKLPPLAQITDITQRTIDWPEAATVTSFTIRESENNQMDTQIIPDAATCPHCLADLFDPNNRRYPLPLYQLYPLRSAFYHHQGNSLRPKKHGDVCFSALPTM